MPLTKETIGTAGATNLGHPRAATAEKGEETSRPQPVCIEVPVTVQGVRLSGAPGKREPFSESTRTVLVFSNGAVLRLGTSVSPGQLMFLTNEHTKKEVVCQVVKSKTYQNVAGYVELEFSEPNPGFWGIRFPGERSESPSAPQGADVSQASSKPHVIESPLPHAHTAGSMNATPLPRRVAGAERPAAPTPPSTQPELIQPKVAAASQDENAMGVAEPLVFSRTRKPTTPAPSIAKHNQDESAAPAFAGHLRLEAGPETLPVQGRRGGPRRSPVIALVAAGMLLAALAGGGWYWWRSRGPETVAGLSPQSADVAATMNVLPPANTQAAPPVSAPAPEPSKTVEVSSPSSAAAPLQPQPVSASRPAPEPSGARLAGPAENPAENRETPNAPGKKLSVSSGFRLSTPQPQRVSSPTNNPEPLAGIDSPPAVPSMPSSAGLTTLVGASSSEPAAPKPEPPTGGELKTARLVSSVPPAYPPLARSQRVEGDVTLDALIDATGRVTTIKVVSGPVLLQQAAVAAVRQWKYEPATLNGSPVPIHLAVTVKFRLR